MKRYAFGAAALTLLVAGGVGYGAIPSSESAVISGCYEKNTGLLRVIDAQAGKNCTKWELPISWNQAGPKGDHGLQGVAGPPGIKGDPGATGSPGAQGDQGPQGNQGPTGPAGPTGAQGPSGQQGQPGPAGPRGPSDLFLSGFGGPIAPLTTAYSTVAHVDVPAGKYLLTGNASFDTGDSETQPVTILCFLTDGSNGSTGFAVTSNPPNVYAVSSLSVSGAQSWGVPRRYELRCRATVGLGGPSPKSLRASSATITALAVENITRPIGTG